VPTSDGGWSFPSSQVAPWEPDNFSHDLRSANQAADMEWSCLDYRHTFGSHEQTDDAVDFADQKDTRAQIRALGIRRGA